MILCVINTSHCQCNNNNGATCADGCYKSNDTCSACPEHVFCKENATIATLQLQDYFWRESKKTTKIYACDNNSCRYSDSSCTADDTDTCRYSDSDCLVGHSGPLCEVCDDENQYFDRYEAYRRCVDCPSLTTVLVKAAVFLHALIAFAAIMYNTIQLNVHVKTTLSRLNLQGMFKIFVSFYQVAAQLNAVYGIELHPDFEQWFEYFKIITLDAFDMIGMPPACIGDMWIRLTVGMAWPYLLTFIVLIGVTLYTITEMIMLKKKKKKIRSFRATLWPRLLYFITIIIYISLPSVSQSIFQAINCKTYASDDDKGTVSYLISDPSLKCDKSMSDYETLLHIFFAGVVFSLLLTFEGFIFLIMKIRKSVRSNRITLLASSCRFLWRDYNETMMFWDIIDTIRKIFLTGFIMFLDSREGSDKVLRLVVAAVLSGLYIGILALARPYKRLDDLYLATISNMILLCCFVAGVILQICNGDSTDDSTGSCQDFVGLSLNHYKASFVFFALMVSMLFVTFIFSVIHMINVITAPSIRLISSGFKPNLELPNDYTSHAFVSHVWASGQAKTHAIVRKLSLLLPGTKFWLDVDDLKALDELENSVSEAAVFLLYYSEGYFRSTNCRRELYAAIEFEKPIILIFQGDEDEVLSEIMTECEMHCKMPLTKAISEKSETGNAMSAFLMADDFDIEMVESPRGVIPDKTHFNRMSILNDLLKDEPIRWLNEGAFSAACVRLISERMFSYLPYYAKHPEAISDGLRVPGEIGSVFLDSAMTVLTHNQDSHDLAFEIGKVLDNKSRGSINICDVEAFFSQGWSSFEESDLEVSEKPKVVFLLYLNKNTFVNGGNPVDNQALSNIVKRVKESGIRIVLAHEQVAEYGGCLFSWFFKETPQELIDPPYEIYRDIATPLYGQIDYRTVSLKTILLNMGAKKSIKRTGLSERFFSGGD